MALFWQDLLQGGLSDAYKEDFSNWLRKEIGGAGLEEALGGRAGLEEPSFKEVADAFEQELGISLDRTAARQRWQRLPADVREILVAQIVKKVSFKGIAQDRGVSLPEVQRLFEQGYDALTQAAAETFGSRATKPWTVSRRQILTWMVALAATPWSKTVQALARRPNEQLVEFLAGIFLRSPEQLQLLERRVQRLHGMIDVDAPPFLVGYHMKLLHETIESARAGTSPKATLMELGEVTQRLNHILGRIAEASRRLGEANPSLAMHVAGFVRNPLQFQPTGQAINFAAMTETADALSSGNYAEAMRLWKEQPDGFFQAVDDIVPQDAGGAVHDLLSALSGGRLSRDDLGILQGQIRLESHLAKFYETLPPALQRQLLTHNEAYQQFFGSSDEATIQPNRRQGAEHPRAATEPAARSDALIAPPVYRPLMTVAWRIAARASEGHPAELWLVFGDEGQLEAAAIRGGTAAEGPEGLSQDARKELQVLWQRAQRQGAELVIPFEVGLGAQAILDRLMTIPFINRATEAAGLSSVGLEERKVAMARDVAAAAWRGASVTLMGSDPVKAWGQTPSQALLVSDPKLFDLVPAAILQGRAVAVDSDDSAAEKALRKLLAQLPGARNGPYAIGHADVIRFLQEYTAWPLQITDRSQFLGLIGLEKFLPAPMAQAIKSTRSYLDLAA